MLGPVLFNLFINELGEGVSVQINDLCLRRFADKKEERNREHGKKITKCLYLENRNAGVYIS